MVDEWYKMGIIAHPRKAVLFFDEQGDVEHKVFIWNQCRPAADDRGALNFAYVPVTEQVFSGRQCEAFFEAVQAAHEYIFDEFMQTYPIDRTGVTDGYIHGTEGYLPGDTIDDLLEI